jgi:hypothetical protein
LTLAAVAALAAFAVPASADPIVTWSAAVNDTYTPADVLNNGTVVNAFAITNGVNSTSFVLNGVTFANNGDIAPFGGDVFGTGGPSTANSDYNAMLAYGCQYAGVAVGLTIGDTYQLQIFAPYFADAEQNGGASEFALVDEVIAPSVSDLTDASGAVASGDPNDIGQYVVATFVADEQSMFLYSYSAADPETGINDNGGGNGDLGAAWVLIQDPTSPATPEPGTLLLLGSGLLAVGRFTRRKLAPQGKS